MKITDIVEFNPQTRLPKGKKLPFISMAATSSGRDIPVFEHRVVNGSGSKFRNGDTLLARITPCLENGKGGYVGNLPEDGLGHGSTEFIVMRAREPSDEKFVYYLSRLPEFQAFAVQRMSGTSGRQRVNWQSLINFEVADISSDARYRIGQILGTLDDKVELNRRMNETLEATARAIFKDWFVDFGPIRSKMEGRAPYLAPDIWNLFPDKLDDEGKPKGWFYRPISDFAKIKGGKQLPKQYILNEGPVPVFGGAGIMGYTADSNADGFIISVGRVGANCGQFFSCRGKAWINNNASLISPYEGVPGEWLLVSLQHTNISLIKRGAAQPFVSNSDIAKLNIVWPGERLLAAFYDALVWLMKKSEANKKEIASLARIRDCLLPRLMSGRILLRSVEEIA